MPRVQESFEERYGIWKGQQGCGQHQQFFVISVPQQHMRPEALIGALHKRGWVENTDPEAREFFDFFWSLHREEVNWEALRPWQIVNHTQNIDEITRKIRFYRHLRSASRWMCDRDVDSFLPRSYDLSESADAEGFAQDFKATFAESLVRRAARGDVLNVSESGLVAALQVVRRRISAPEDAVWDFFDGQLVCDEEWSVISQQAQVDGQSKAITAKHRSASLPQIRGASASRTRKSQTGPSSTRLLTLASEAQGLVEHLKQLASTSHPQMSLNGPNNLWILKPGELSRGRGVTVMDSLAAISRFFGGWFTVQKYQENPLLISRLGKGLQKHDLRQHVIVESWDPLRVWLASELYVRFAAQAYDFNDKSNPGIHLTNTCVGKQVVDPNDLQWSTAEYAEHLQSVFHSDIYNTTILPQIKDIVKMSLKCLQEALLQNHGGRAYEMIGYDFCVSDDLKVWLIEANEMPSIEYDSPASERVISSALEDTVRIMLSEPDASGFFKILMDEQAIPALPSTVGNLDCSLHGVGYVLDSENGAFRLKAPGSPHGHHSLRSNITVRDFLVKIERRKSKEEARKAARLRRAQASTRLVLDRIDRKHGRRPRSISTNTLVDNIPLVDSGYNVSESVNVHSYKGETS